MGLSGPKKRTKIAHDPNNNNWAKSTNSFGHKILASQGWKPGDTLGAKDANHASHYTVGSNSHIRVLLKDDNLGLGAARGGNNAETFGLSLYSGILGRLNGKAEAQVEQEQKAQRDVELALYQGRKYGNINFISAGYLVGDKIEDKRAVMSSLKSSIKEAAPADTVAGNKRKRPEPQETTDQPSSDSDSSDSDADEPLPKSKKNKESKKDKSKKSKKSSAKDSGSDSADDTSKSKAKKSKKDKKEKKRKTAETSSEDETRAEKKLRKAERRARKEERRRRKEAKRASASATPSTAPATPAEPAQPVTAAPLVGRHAVRQRYIAQKRLAHLNPQALKEIFMVKA